MRKLICFAAVVAALSLSSCIQDEPKNVEADIEKVYFVPEDGVEMISSPVILNQDIMLMIPLEDGSTELAPRFELSEGARINPISGTVRDFAEPQVYTVTSENGEWSKKYTIRIVSDIVLKYDFEHYTTGKYDVFYELLTDDHGTVLQHQDIWASGNDAIALLMTGKPSSDYPTSAVLGAGMNDGQGEPTTAAKLTTISTGWLGSFAGKPIAAGNLFIGTFDGSNAMGDPLGATKFGLPVNKKPKSLKGWYKYKSGTADYQGNPYPADQPDSCRIYAVLYKSENGEKLDGSNILSSPKVVATAFFNAPAQTDEWAPFENEPGDGEIEFQYRAAVNDDDLKAYKYNLALVFSSSYRGDEFLGAINSTLYIDDVEVTTFEDDGE